MEKKRLLVICHGFPPYYGGGEHAAFYLARAAARSGRWAVTVLTSDIGGRLPAQEEMHGVAVRRVPARKRHWRNHTVRELISFLASAGRYRPEADAEARPDAILAHFTLPAGWVARRLARRLGVPYAVVLHGSDVPGHQPGRFGWIYPLVVPPVCRIWRDAAAVIAVSEPLKQLALGICPGLTVRVIPNGVDSDLFRPVERTVPDGARPWKIVMVAQLCDVKGHAVLFEALAGWTDAPEWDLDLYGAGPEWDILHRLAAQRGLSGRIRFHGLVEREDIVEALRTADIFVLPSFREGLPLSLLEAMACGVPVIASSVGEIPSVVQDGVHGLLVPPGDVAAWRAALGRLAADRSLARKLAAAGVERARSMSWDRLWAAYEDALASTNGLRWGIFGDQPSIA